MKTLSFQSKAFLTVAPGTLPIALILPYAFVASRFRGLAWVYQTGDRPFWFTLGLALLLALAASFALRRLQPLGASLYRAGILLVTAETAYLAMTERRHSLLVLVFLLFAGQILLSERARQTLRLPFFDSRRRWWEAYPKAIPGLRVEVSAENGNTTKVRLSNFGLEGCFIFAEEAAVPAPKSVRISAGEQTLLEAEVEVVNRTGDGFGWGLRFNTHALDGDWSKDLQDYIGYLRRSGYEVA